MGEIARRTTTPAKPAKKTAAKKAAAKKAAAKKVPSAKFLAGKAAAKKAGKKIPAKKVAAKKATAKKSPTKRASPHNDTNRPHKKAKKAHTPKAATTRADARQDHPGTTTQGPTMRMPRLPAAPVDPLTVLGLTEPLQVADLRRAWRGFAARHHPDRGGDAVTFARGQHAYDELQRRLSSHD